MSAEESPLDSPDFTFSFSGNLRESVQNGALIIDLDFGRGTEPYAPAARTVLPAEQFNGDGQLARDWANRFQEIFGATMQEAVVQALQRNFWDAASLSLIEMKLASYGKTEAMQDHLVVTEMQLRAKFGLPPSPGRPPQWKPTELAGAISQIMVALRPDCRTYGNVAEKLMKLYPGKAPKTGESLRKMVKLLGVDWKQLKKIASTKRS
jgi:hypothetical protein